MGRFVETDDVVNKYKILGDVLGRLDYYIPNAESIIEGRLSGYFTTPFSSNNVTAVNLVIDQVYADYYQYNDPEKAKGVIDSIDKRINMLRNGEMAMVDSSGAVTTTVGGTVYCNTKGYSPTFDMQDTEYMQVDSSQQYAEYNDTVL